MYNFFHGESPFETHKGCSLLSFNLAKLPNLWKIANLIPIYKGSGNKFTVDNYRPISLTSNICKVMESSIFEKIYNYFSSRNLQMAAQHRFRQKSLQFLTSQNY